MSIDNAEYVVMINHSGQKSTQKINLKVNEPIVIGRSWQNDVVINDEFVDSEHLKITVDDSGSLCIEDLNTANGTRIGKKLLKTALNYPKGTQLVLGDTALSIIDVDTMVAPAIKRDTVHKLSRKFQSIVWYFIATVAAAIALIGGSAMVSTGELNSKAIAGLLSTTVVSALLVACAGGMLSMLFRRTALFGLHYVFFCWTFVVFTILQIGWDIVSFNIDHLLTISIMENFVYGGFFFMVLYGALSMITRISRIKKIPIAAIIVFVPIIFAYVKSGLVLEHENWSSYANVNSVNQPPMFNFRNPTTVESHLDSTNKLFSDLEDDLFDGSQSIVRPETIQLSESDE